MYKSIERNEMRKMKSSKSRGKELDDISKKNNDLRMEVDSLDERKVELEKEKQAIRKKLKDLKTVAVDRQVFAAIKEGDKSKSREIRAAK
eukprot:TRINITY_DN1117_c0_g1_i1.p2 TRINITY_DN1117_c0_g1~~TRINITY_DN1117_c0_g1_i1.p2  ORF type:complete len:90 (+),score=24.86 TRINITY_DN1117_c0_g1_i1:888-1157(+)